LCLALRWAAVQYHNICYVLSGFRLESQGPVNNRYYLCSVIFALPNSSVQTCSVCAPNNDCSAVCSNVWGVTGFYRNPGSTDPRACCTCLTGCMCCSYLALGYSDCNSACRSVGRSDGYYAQSGSTDPA